MSKRDIEEVISRLSEYSEPGWEALDSIVDRKGLKWIVKVLQDICYRRAELTRMSDWADEKRAGLWEKAGRVVSSIYSRIPDLPS